MLPWYIFLFQSHRVRQICLKSTVSQKLNSCFLYQLIDFLWCARSCSKTILPVGVVLKARFTSGGKATGWLSLFFWISVAVLWDTRHAIASVPGTTRWRNVVVSSPPSVIRGLRYSVGHIHGRIGGNISYKIDISKMCFLIHDQSVLEWFLHTSSLQVQDKET